ncbi:hypothetical protein CUMW_240510 [Citrus unshiu]|uniref:Uncharacterized protein n=1 Tax=Citrus unshiu TaxID=55188 RepID=A0A2H5QL64_CITUN|nr:hypothetical protein CUMW_240510 [Citrus unshiu]
MASMISTNCAQFSGLRRSSPTQSYSQHVNSHLRLVSSRRPRRSSSVVAMASSNKFLCWRNWKMGTKESITKLVSDLNDAKLGADVDVVGSASFVYIDQVRTLGSEKGWSSLQRRNQCEQLKDIGLQVGCSGHSERRHFIGKKAAYALSEGTWCNSFYREQLARREKQEKLLMSMLHTQFGDNVVMAYELYGLLELGKVATPSSSEVHVLFVLA